MLSYKLEFNFCAIRDGFANPVTYMMFCMGWVIQAELGVTRY